MPPSMEKNIVLVAPGSTRVQIGAIVHLPLALMSLAAWLRRDERYSGRIRILDMEITEISPEDFKDAAVVGITAMTGHMITHGLEAARLAREANSDTVIVWGGIHPTLLPEQTIANDLADAVVVGEGEATFKEVVDAVFSGDPIANIPGTCVLGEHREILKGPARLAMDLETLPLPAYDLVNMDDYHGIEHQFDYQSSRGCPFRCAFCYNMAFQGRTWRSKSADKVVEELTFLHSQYNVRSFAMDDDEFFIKIKRAESIFDKLIEQNSQFGIIASCRLDVVQKLPPGMLNKMKQLGVVQMFFGAESGSEQTLREIEKDLSTDDIVAGALRVAHSGIRPVLSFMSGFPGETFDEFKKTMVLIQRLWRAHPLITINGIFPFNPYPGTPLYDQALAMGLKPPLALAEWGSWSFQYDPDHPWLDRKMRRWMRISFFIVRFRYYLARYEDRYKNNWRVKLLRFLVQPLSISARIRWTKKWFAAPWEWNIFAALVKRSFGYL